MRQLFLIFTTAVFLQSVVSSCHETASKDVLVRNVVEFEKAVQSAKPGTEIVLANGIWNNAELLFEGEGTEADPIVLSAETKGKVVLTGSSNLRIAGSFLVVEGLVFKDGFTPTNEVISFRKDEKNLANSCRLTECVIDNFSPPERHEQDTWIAIYGKNNRIDHNHLEGKRNLGVTMTVRLNTKESQENFHRIDHNYFGPRTNLGANGGETLRIGTSHFSLSNSNTLVESNYFDRCSGEHEIISNKSCQNTFRNNVFYECSGTLTMRHGNETLVDGNVFIGNDKPSTGGIRVINEKQTVINNYAIGLKGYRFRGALVVMNGVPDSPINRYFQVDSATIKNNVFVNCDHIQLCAGSDAERSAVPVNSTMTANVFYHDSKKEIFTVYDDITGITMADNLIKTGMRTDFQEGFKEVDMYLEKDDQGFLIPNSAKKSIGFVLDSSLAKKNSVGTSWYPKEYKEVLLGSGKVVTVQPGSNTLFEAVKSSEPGDILQLSAGETYVLSKSIDVNHPLSIVSSAQNKAEVLFEKQSLFDIQNGGSLSLKGIVFDGKIAPDYSGNTVISTSKYSMNRNYKLFIEDCVFQNLDMNYGFDAIRVYKNTFADTISIVNSKFKKITGNVLALDKENDDKGIYNAEYVIINNSIFEDVEGMALKLYRGGTDESTFGPFLEVDHCVFDKVGYGKRNRSKVAMELYGVQDIALSNSIFNESMALKIHLVVGEPIVNVLNNNFYKSDELIITGDQKYNLKNVWNLDPEFMDGKYKLLEKSALNNKGTDHLNLGLISNM